MKRFDLIEHTADTGVIAYGKSLNEAFANAAYGLFSIIAELTKVRAVESRTIEINAEDMESLLFQWLNQLVYIFDVEHVLFKKFVVSELNDTHLRATVWGEKYQPSRHEIKLGVKSATYYMLKVDREKNTVQVIFDV